MTNAADPVRSAVVQRETPAGGAGLPWRALLVIGIASFAVCALVDLTYFAARTDLISNDEGRLLQSAQNLLATGTFRIGADKAFEMPGTAAFFAAIMWMFPAHPVAAIRLVQAFLVGLQSVFVGALAHTLFRVAGVTILAALIAGFYPYFVFTQGMALTETLFTVLLIAGFLSLYRWRSAGARTGGGLVGSTALFVAAAMVKATITFMAPVLVTVAAIGVRKASSLVAVAAVATLAFALLMTPWWIRNYRELGAFVPFTTTSSIALFSGNNPQNPDADALWPVWDARTVPEIANADELARSRTFRDLAIQYIVADPAGFVKRAALKFARFWSLTPRAEAFQNPLYLIIGAASFSPVLLLALVCGISQRHRFVELLPIYLTIAYFTAIYTVTVASIRYRLPIEPLLIVLAARPGFTLLSRLSELFRHLPQAAPVFTEQVKYSTNA
jgi:hypothetical protein